MKKVIYLLLLLVVVFAITYLVRYQRGPCLCDQIPKSAEAVILVNARNLEHHFLLDAISNPSAYFTKKKDVVVDSVNLEETIEVTEETKVSLADCLSMPAYVLVYKSGSNTGSWHSNLVQVKDVSKLEMYLLENGFKGDWGNGLENGLEDADRSTTKMFRKGAQVVSLIDERARFSYLADTEVAVAYAEEGGGYMSQGDQMFDMMMASSDDMIFVDKNGQQASLNFRDGVVEIDGYYDLPQLQQLIDTPSGDAIGQFSANFEVSSLIGTLTQGQRQQFTNFTKLQLDSLSQHWDGSIQAVLTDMVGVSDTITSYEYDDDFNQVEIQKIKTSLSPSYTMQMGISPEGISYMKRKNAIVADQGQNVLAIMPLVKTYAKSIDGGLSLYTVSDQLTTTASSDKLNLSLDVAKYKSAAAGSNLALDGMVEAIKSIRLHIGTDNKIEGRIDVDGERNALISLIGN